MKKGALLLELLIVIAILSIVFISVGLIYTNGIRTFGIVKAQSIVQAEAVQFVNLLTDGLPGGNHGLLGAKDIQTADITNIIFTDKNNDTIRYYLSGTAIYKKINAGTDTEFFDLNDEIDVTALQFKYYNNTDQELTTPVSDATQITKIKFTVTLKGKDTTVPETSLTFSIKPRNLFQI